MLDSTKETSSSRLMQDFRHQAHVFSPQLMLTSVCFQAQYSFECKNTVSKHSELMKLRLNNSASARILDEILVTLSSKIHSLYISYKEFLMFQINILIPKTDNHLLRRLTDCSTPVKTNGN